MQKMLNWQETIDTYLKVVDSWVKPVILYGWECWIDYLKKKVFANSRSMCKQMIDVKIFMKNVKVVSEPGKVPLKKDVGRLKEKCLNIYTDFHTSKQIDNCESLKRRRFGQKMLNSKFEFQAYEK